MKMAAALPAIHKAKIRHRQQLRNGKPFAMPTQQNNLRRRCRMKAVTPWRPMRELDTMRQQMEEFFEQLSGRFFGPGEREHSLWGTDTLVPAIESHVDKDTLIIKADLPGIDPKEVSISVTGNQLTITGERRRQEKKEEKDYFYR